MAEKTQTKLYEKAYKLLQAEDYIISRLTQRAVTEFSIASRTCLLDVKQKKWSDTILDTFDIEQAKLPELLEPGSFAGTIDDKVAEEWKLSKAVKVFTGAGDQQAAAIGSGAVFEGSVSIGIGTSSALSFTIAEPIPDKSKRIILNCAAIPGMWEYEPPIWNTGGLIKWYFDQIENKPVSAYYDILEATRKIPPGSEGVIALPYFSGSGSPR
jgi:sugar (pentulose or hexulose) kinase